MDWWDNSPILQLELWTLSWSLDCAWLFFFFQCIWTVTSACCPTTAYAYDIILLSSEFCISCIDRVTWSKYLPDLLSTTMADVMTLLDSLKTSNWFTVLKPISIQVPVDGWETPCKKLAYGTILMSLFLDRYLKRKVDLVHLSYRQCKEIPVS